jgi:predicted nucleic acid-binding protein
LKYLLDTDVISQRTKAQPVPEIATWLQTISEDDLCLSAVSIQEVRTGVESMPSGRKRRAVEAWLEDDLLRGFANRILVVDATVADLCGRLIAEASRAGHMPSLGDALIAATARVHKLRLATLNRRHFKWLGAELVEF